MDTSEGRIIFGESSQVIRNEHHEEYVNERPLGKDGSGTTYPI